MPNFERFNVRMFVLCGLPLAIDGLVLEPNPSSRDARLQISASSSACDAERPDARMRAVTTVASLGAWRGRLGGEAEPCAEVSLLLLYCCYCLLLLPHHDQTLV